MHTSLAGITLVAVTVPDPTAVVVAAGALGLLLVAALWFRFAAVFVLLDASSSFSHLESLISAALLCGLDPLLTHGMNLLRLLRPSLLFSEVDTHHAVVKARSVIVVDCLQGG